MRKLPSPDMSPAGHGDRTYEKHAVLGFSGMCDAAHGPWEKCTVQISKISRVLKLSRGPDHATRRTREAGRIFSVCVDAPYMTTCGTCHNFDRTLPDCLAPPDGVWTHAKTA